MDFSVGDLFSFEKTIATKVIKVVYFIGLVGIAIAFLVEIVSSFGAMGLGFFYGLGGLIASIIGTAIGLLMWRIICEAWIAFFGIYERLGEIKANTAKSSP